MRNYRKQKADKPAKNLPTHRAKYRKGEGKEATYETIGAAWFDDETGAIFVRLNGIQMVGDPFCLYPIEDEAA